MPTSSNRNRIAATFHRLRQRDDTALIAYLMAGDPSLADTETLIMAVERAGADLIEIGVPFSDPIADGPIIQRAAERALRAGASLPGIVRMIKALRSKTHVPLILMTYYNTVMAMGERRFCHDAVDAGVDGVVVPDMPAEEADVLQKAADDAGGPVLIFLLAPTSTPARTTEVITRTHGFIYYVSMTGITGAKLRDVDAIQRNVQMLQRKARKPVAVGFGIATPDEARQIAAFADGVIVGSALVRTIEEHRDSPDCIQAVGEFTGGLKAALAFTDAQSPLRSDGVPCIAGPNKARRIPAKRARR